MTAPNTGAPTVGNAPTDIQPGESIGGEAARPLTDAERATRPAHAGGYSDADRVAAIEKKYGAKFESTHALDRSSFVAAIVIESDGTRIAARGASMSEAISALEARLARIGEAFTNA